MYIVFSLEFKYHFFQSFILFFVICGIMQTLLELETVDVRHGMGNKQFPEVLVKVPYWQSILIYLIFTQNSEAYKHPYIVLFEVLVFYLLASYDIF